MEKEFLKVVKHEEYEMIFNSKTGVEVLQGTNGKPDPFCLQLPSLLDIGIMGHCENNCYFCYQGDEDEPNMSLDSFKEIIDQVRLQTNQVALGGRGDPNLHENFKEIVGYARENKVVPNYTTSGNGLTDEQIEISKMCGAVAVSDYGQPYTYDAIKRFMDAGIKTNIHIIFSKLNYEKCIKLISGYDPWFPVGKTELLERTETLVDIDRLNAVIFLLYKPIGVAKDKPELFPTKYQIHVFMDRILNSSAKFSIGMDSCLTQYLLRSDMELNEIQKLTIDSCESARMSGYISPTLQMVPCSFADNEKCGMNLKEKDIDYIWNRSHKFTGFRKKLKQKPHVCPLGF